MGKDKGNLYLNYPNKPLILGGGDIEVADNGKVYANIEQNKKEFSFYDGSALDLIDSDNYGLIEDLIEGSELFNSAMHEFSNYDKFSAYGEWVYYPASDKIVRYAPRFWHRLALVLRNSTLYRDSNVCLSWKEIRQLFDNAVIAVAGCSVGNNVARSIVQSLRPKHIKIADVKEYKITNANRVPISYKDIGRNKAQVTAEQIHSIDPFINISVYAEGVGEENIEDLILGNSFIGEPAANIVVDETDDPEIKLMLWQAARKARIPVVMASDLGSAVQVDIRRFDLEPKLSLACGISDEELFTKRDAWKANVTDKNSFYEFVFALVGHNYRHVAEFKRIILNQEEPLFGGVPQLGSTAAMAGAMAAESIARIILGDVRPERMFIDKNTGNVIIEGRLLGGGIQIE
ncbi:MAG: ThiF family adenylyltransferase [Candidatus Spechtbacterales bacterium]|nr:ThiF family adenylyltransferase [Candidatus Spechtbacterales bacterium]